MSPARRDLTPALVVGLGGGALAAARALGRHGVPVWLGGPRRMSATSSRHVRGFVPLPELGRDPREFAERLLHHARVLRERPVLIAVDDLTLADVAGSAPLLAAAFRLTGPAPEIAAEVLDKARQYARVEAAGLPLPRTWVPGQAAEGALIARDARFPLVVKGRFPLRFRNRHGLKAVSVETPQELRAALEWASDPVVQELVPGGVERVYEYATFVDRGGAVVAAVTMRKLDEDPAPYGSATAAEALRVPELESLGRRLLEVFDYRGLAHSEWKLDPRDGVFRFIELNARIPVSASLHAAVGADTIWPAYAEAAGLPFEPAFQRPGRVVWIRPELRLTRRARLAPPPRLPDSPAGRTRWVADLFDLRDPGPLLREASRALGRRLSRLARRRSAEARSAAPGGSPESPSGGDVPH